MTPNPNHTNAPNSAITTLNSHSGQVKLQTRKLSVTSSVFWIMKMSSNPTLGPLISARMIAQEDGVFPQDVPCQATPGHRRRSIPWVGEGSTVSLR